MVSATSPLPGPLTNRQHRVSLCNMVLTIFLGIKNTPLSPIAGRSYESINVLHRWCGYTTILSTIVHTAYVATTLRSVDQSLTTHSAYVPGLFETGYTHLLTIPGTIGADVAGIAMIFILLTANVWVRRRHYEFFYVTHVVLVIVAIITGMYITTPRSSIVKSDPLTHPQSATTPQKQLATLST
jgi:predicted ferric reductase